MKELLEITDDRKFDISGIGTNDEATMQLIPSVNEVYQKALNLRPEIQSSRLSIDAADLDIDIAKAGYYPSISLTAGIGRCDAVHPYFRQQTKQNQRAKSQAEQDGQ